MARDWRRPDRPIGYGRQSIDQRDVDAVEAVLRGDWLTQGPAVERFEAALADATGAPHAVAVNSGTAALHLALLACGVGPGGRVLTTANTFLASASAAVMCGAEVEFCDVEPQTGNLDVDRVADRLDRSDELGAIDAVVAVHFAGLPCDVGRLVELSRRHGFELLVDGAHALGAELEQDGRRRRLGEVDGVAATTLSFHPVKHVTTGEGGAVLFGGPRGAERAEHARRLRAHGVARDPAARPFDDSVDAPPWFAPMHELGYNYRLSDLQAALGTAQLARLSELLDARRRIARRYATELDGYRRAAFTEGHTWHLYVIHVPAPERDELMAWLRAGGIGTQVHYYPVPLQPWFRRRYGEPRVPHAVEHARTALSLPLYPGLADDDQSRVIEALAAWRRG